MADDPQGESSDAIKADRKARQLLAKNITHFDPFGAFNHALSGALASGCDELTAVNTALNCMMHLQDTAAGKHLHD